MEVTATEFKKNLGKYLTLVNKEEIIITRNGIPIAQISPPKKKSIVNQLIGIIPDDGYSLDDARMERLLRNEDSI
ncbi:hypothetical protein BHF68_07000 [Desulfuribacillus alkaliarsenatis]|uniref:Antitoxin n=1 Tax=Desulfuribacillus alkaliarsenatis TaxID=766136 RepID=A0A1E5G228_9FIRM|nr:hypothetical protein BHF68_07000 [Desulfuribacillus alkaliarsenatis]